MQELGERLIQEENFDAPNVAVKLDAVLNRRGKIKAQAEDKKGKLSDSLLYAQFNRDCSEVRCMTDNSSLIYVIL